MDQQHTMEKRELGSYKSCMRQDLHPAPHQASALKETLVFVELRTATQQELWCACMEAGVLASWVHCPIWRTLARPRLTREPRPEG